MTNYQSEILEYLARYEVASVGDLSRHLGISPSTVRRHLSQLHEKGLIIRTHGGASLPHPIRYDPQFESRASRQAEAKRLIALAARSLISPNQVIGISGGTTCTEFGRLIRGMKNLTVVTNAVNVAMELRGAENIRVLLTGGLLNQNSYELIGNLVTETLKNIHLDIAFLGASGIDLTFGFSMSDEPEAVAGRAFMNSASRTVILADHTKIGKTTFARLCGINEVHLLITDEGITPQQLSTLKKVGLKVWVVSLREQHIGRFIQCEEI